LAKKVRGKLHYFGRIADDPQGAKALDVRNERKDDLTAGKTPRARKSESGRTKQVTKRHSEAIA